MLKTHLALRPPLGAEIQVATDGVQLEAERSTQSDVAVPVLELVHFVAEEGWGD